MKSPERLMKIKTTSLQRIGKVVLWVLVVLLLLKGVASILENRGQDELQHTIDNYRTAAEQRETVRAGAAAFAENFVYEYYSFDGSSNQDYTARVGKYLAESMAIPKPMGSGVSAAVLSAKTTKISFVDDTRMDVDVSVKARYGGSGDAALSGISGSDEISDGTALSDSTVNTSAKDINIQVPVVWHDGKYAVDAMPLLIPAEDSAVTARAPGYSGTEVSMKEKEEIKQMLESFLKTYCEGSDQEVSYYLTPDSEIRHGLNGVVTFHTLKWITAYYLEAENEYLANASITVKDNCQELSQEMYLTLIKEGSKYYIQNIAARAAIITTENGGN